MILNLETSAEVCSVALSHQGVLIGIREQVQGMKSGTLLTVFIEELLQEHHLRVQDLDAVAVSRGPGSYTGLRIGVSAAKGLCYGAGIPLIAISTLEALTEGYVSTLTPELSSGVICPLIDARRMEVYTAVYDFSGVLCAPARARIVGPGSFDEWLSRGPVHFIGNAVTKCRDALAHPNAVFCDRVMHSARNLPRLSHEAFQQQRFEDIAYFEPFYLKDFMPTQPKASVIHKTH